MVRARPWVVIRCVAPHRCKSLTFLAPLASTACKDFCIHRVKLAHSRHVTVHELFAGETDKTRLQRYNALSAAGVVWELVARRQHSTRKRAVKRRRSSASSVVSTDSDGSAPACHKRRRPLKATTSTTGQRMSARARRKPARLSEYVDDAGSVTSDSSAESVGSAASDPTADARRAFHAATAPVVSPVRTAPAPYCPPPAAEAAPVSGWGMFSDFDAAVDALGVQDLAASNLSVDEFTRVVSQLDAHAPSLFDDVEATGGAMPSLLLDASVLDTLGSCDWDSVVLSPAPLGRPGSHSALTVCM